MIRLCATCGVDLDFGNREETMLRLCADCGIDTGEIKVEKSEEMKNEVSHGYCRYHALRELNKANVIEDEEREE